MNGRPVVLVIVDEEGRPPGLDGLDPVVELVDADAGGLEPVIGDAEVVFSWRARRESLEPVWGLAQRLRWIQAASAGVDFLLFPALVESDVVLTNARGVFDVGMAEYVLGLMLAFAKGFPETFASARERMWAYRPTEPLSGRRLLVVGAGPIGTAIGRLARANGMEVTGVARSARPGEGVFDEVHPVGMLPELLCTADYVVNALPLTDDTRLLFDAGMFARMKRTARFLNIGRGGTVDERGLADALRDERIAGAALDVFEKEPLPAGSPLWDLPNLIVSPHMSGDETGWEGRVVEVFRRNLDRWLAGEPLENVVDKRLGYVPTPAVVELPSGS